MSQILQNDEIAEGINSLKSKQRKVFNVVQPRKIKSLLGPKKI